MTKEKLLLILSVKAREFSFLLRKHFIIGMTVTNIDDVTIQPELHLTKLMINGKDSFTWMEAVSNGHREANWSFLPPGQSTSISWSTMGEQLFQTPGEYILQLELGDIKSEKIKIKVRKD